MGFGVLLFLFMMIMVAGAYMMSAGSIVLLQGLNSKLMLGSAACPTVATVCESETGAKVFRFVTHDGKRYELLARPGTLHYPVGANVPIVYHAQQPSIAHIRHAGWMSMWFAPLCTLFLGVVFASVGFTNLVALAPH